MNKTGIEYLDYTWNPMHGCSRASTGCKKCWAEKMSQRLAGMGVNGYSKEDPFKVVCLPDKLNEPSTVKKPSRIGVSFMGDLFHKDVQDSFINDIWETMMINDQHTYQILTKRPERMKEWIDKHIYDQSAFKNIWLGVSVENQEQADKRIPILLQIPAAVRFLSVEPMLERMDLSFWFSHGKPDEPEGWGIDQVICGAESGAGARPMNPEWARDLRDQCKYAGTPIFIKQLQINGRLIKDTNDFPLDLRIREYPNAI